ncbi:MAG: hypothetical protein NC086_03115, partial [Alistipes sp.]|nr:hypothetical protein [Alistipes sp.]
PITSRIVLDTLIPDFSYELIQLNDYTPKELISRKDEISLIMMFNKLQNAENISAMLTKVNPQELEAILKETPPHILDIMANVIRAFCRKINAPQAETDKLMELVKEVKMGILFENMEHIDIQEERRKTKETREQLEMAQHELALRLASLADKDVELDEKDAALADLSDRFAKSIITTCLDKKYTKEQAGQQIQQELRISAGEAEAYLQKYWPVKQ